MGGGGGDQVDWKYWIDVVSLASTLTSTKINELTWEWVQCEPAEIDNRTMQEEREEGNTEDHKLLDVKGTTTSIISH